MDEYEHATEEQQALPGYFIRWALAKDRPQIMAIERQSFARPWTEEQYIAINRGQGVITMVVECQGELAGFCTYELQPRRIEILTLAVKKDCRKLGVGRALVDKVASKLSIARRQRIGVAVSKSMKGSQRFLEAVGFVQTDSHGDLMWFESLLIEPGC